MRIVTAAQMRLLDSVAVSKYGIPGILLMENAGLSVFLAAEDALEGLAGKRVIVMAGPGNNGGDGYVVARHMANAGALVAIAGYADPAKYRPDSRANYDIARAMGLQIIDQPLGPALETLLSEADLTVDALLGTGFSGGLRQPMPEVIEAVNAYSDFVVSVDIPSGVEADTGIVSSTAVLADLTVTFALPKVGLMVYPGAKYAGDLVVADISIPVDELDSTDCAAFVLDADAATARLPYRPIDAHKGTFGHVGIIAGSVGMTGAAVLSANGALAIGAGLVSVAAPESLKDILECKLTEAMTFPVRESGSRCFGLGSLDDVKEFLRGKDAVVLGPGLGRREETVQFVLELLPTLEVPVLLDADALYAISTDLSVLKRLKVPAVITPHPGEMARLVGVDAAQIQSDRLKAASSFAAEHGVVVVLKGAGSIVAGPNGDSYINTSGCDGMASGGVGDVLSGIIGGLLAQGVAGLDAAAAGVYMHGLAGEFAARLRGHASMTASDVAQSVSEALRVLNGESEATGQSD